MQCNMNNMKILYNSPFYVNFRYKRANLETCPFPMFLKLHIGYITTIYLLRKDSQIGPI